MKIITRINQLVLVSMLSVFSCQSLASGSPIKVDVGGDTLKVGPNYLPIWSYNITSMEDEVIITSIVVNRGNCLPSIAGRGNNMNKRLGYGETFTFTIPTNKNYTQCKPLELIVGTPNGSLKYTW
ncbi:hypothetical protein ETI19_09430 [Salmonella enterica]|nr:hypothetical protein [Salmonella enterica]